jgi:hypothetical protein
MDLFSYRIYVFSYILGRITTEGFLFRVLIYARALRAQKLPGSIQQGL